MPVTVGSVESTGTGGTTTAVASDSAALPEPPALLAVSVTRSSCPTSSATGLYVSPVAPPIATHALPDELQRSHWYTYPVGEFVHSPWCSVNVWPCWAVPVTVGSVESTGTGGTTTAVASDSAALPEPPALLAVSVTRSLCPTSSATGLYVSPVAPPIATQLVPDELQRSHW